MPKEQRTTLHEIRSLGLWFCEKAGYSQGHVQVLMDHSDEKMIAYY
jgi:integrase